MGVHLVMAGMPSIEQPSMDFALLVLRLLLSSSRTLLMLSHNSNGSWCQMLHTLSVSAAQRVIRLRLIP
jgi:hypothetical protein